ncbi:uncharacterized protein LOC144756156 isoform X3 [Lissotriton helveticus]
MVSKFSQRGYTDHHKESIYRNEKKKIRNISKQTPCHNIEKSNHHMTTRTQLKFTGQQLEPTASSIRASFLDPVT